MAHPTIRPLRSSAVLVAAWLLTAPAPVGAWSWPWQWGLSQQEQKEEAEKVEVKEVWPQGAHPPAATAFDGEGHQRLGAMAASEVNKGGSDAGVSDAAGTSNKDGSVIDVTLNSELQTAKGSISERGSRAAGAVAPHRDSGAFLKPEP
mmetsp:Transcript_67531/g.170404  ORF Transcript_67531/g.170404 Transcript_67531/m.170404 type:complete len:148 (+) Transcript_67531:75-518(+)